MNNTSQMRPIAPRNPGGKSWRDKAKDGFDLRSLERLVRDCEDQPDRWRLRADLCHAYYDGKQFTPEQEEFVRMEGMEARPTNLIARVINSVLGSEARNRSDVRIESDTDEIADITDVLNRAMKEAQRESYADMAVSSAYASQVKGGLGWVEVSRNSDPLDYAYRVRDVHRSEMHWDWRATDFLLRDARWQVRSQWHDLDEVQVAMPEHADILEMMCNSWDGFAETSLLQEQGNLEEMTRAFDDFRRFQVRATQWVDTSRKRVRLYEVWYKVPATAVVLRLGPTRTVLFDDKNPLHVLAVSKNLVKVEKVNTRQVRMAIFAGPYRLLDKPTTRKNFPYVPFFAFRDDIDNSPYGLIEGMVAPQDEYNDRRLRIRWLLKARQILVDNDALDTKYNNLEDLAGEAMRPDMVLVRNAARRNAEGVQILSNLSLQKEQVDVMQDSRMLIQDVPGVNNPQMGASGGGITANSAMQTLVEQGLVTLGELNDNYRNSRRLVYENLLDLIVEDHCEAELRVMIGEGAARRAVVLNTFDQKGMPVNWVKDAPTRVGLSDVPSSPAARMQQQTMLSEIIKSLGGNPQAVAVLIPPFLEASPLDSETRRQAVEDFRKVMGMPPGGDRAARQAADEQQAQEVQAQKALAMKDAEGKVNEQLAKVEKLLSEVQLNLAKAEQARAQAQQTDAMVDDALSEADEAMKPKPAMH